MENRGHHVQATKKARLLVGDGDERRLRVPRPQRDLRFARRMMKCLYDRGGRESPERERHRVVRGFIVNDVEIARALDGRGEVEHLVELPWPHVLVVPVAVL